MRHVLVVRLDSLGDMLICGPAIRAVSAHSDRVTVLAGPGGAAAAALLPGVDDVLVWRCPWIVADPPDVDAADLDDVVRRVAAVEVTEAVILTSFHQSALPTALLLRLAGVARISAVSTNYPGALLDVRLSEPADAPEPERMLAIVAGAGFVPPADDDGRLRIMVPQADVAGLPAAPFVVVHPGVSAPARGYPRFRWREAVAALTGAGWPVVLTGSAAEKDLTAELAEGLVGAVDFGGRLELNELATVIAASSAVVVANTGPAHLAAALDRPVVSLFAPVVPASRWAPYRTRSVVLGDQDAPCRGTRAQVCPVPGHPCLTSVTGRDVLGAVTQLLGEPPR
jgi:ADP-heptose:LPS heptosyltransferase